MPRLRRVDCSAPGSAASGTGAGSTTTRRRDDDRRPRGGRADQGARHPPGVEGRLDLPPPQRAYPGDRLRRGGRKQYLYHPVWRQDRDREKFTRWSGSRRLCRGCASVRRGPRPARPRARTGARVLGAAARPGLLPDRQRALRGRERDLRPRDPARKHVRIERHAAVFDYTAKGSKRHRQEIADPAVVPTIKALKERTGGGRELLA